MAKKILKWVGIVLLVLIILLVTAPFIFKDKIKSMVAKAINEQVDATVAFEDVSLSLFSNFPMASVTIDKLSIINKAPFEGDTLVYMGRIDASMSLNELFKGEGEAMSLETLHTKDGVVNILFNENGVGNFDIAIKDDSQKPEDNASESKPFALDLKDYQVENLRFRYYDAGSKMSMVIDSLYHEGHGNFEQNVLDLDTKTTANLTFDMDGTNYMRDVHLKLDAILGIDLENSVYTFKENKAHINQLPLEFDGSLALLEEGQKFDLTFKTPTSSFKNFLGLVPESYSGNLEGVETQGDCSITGMVKGVMTDDTIPAFNITILSDNASFKYPDLPKSIQNIVIDAKVVNETGIINDTYVNVDKLGFRIDKDIFNANATIKNVAENPLVNAALKGTINLGNLGQAYPVDLDIPLAGIIKADISTKFDMKSIEENKYENTDNRGSLALSGFTYSGDDLPNPIKINQANLQFNPTRVNLSEFNAETGGSDLAMSGSLNNFYGFLFKDQVLKGNFNLSSNKLMVSDFMTAETPEATKGTKKEDTKETAQTGKPAQASEPVKIPAFLDCTITAKANTVVYDDLNLKNVAGKLIIRDETVTLENLRTDMFQGVITANGNVSTKTNVPNFTMSLDLNKVDIPSTFTQLEMLKSIAPIANVITGKLSTDIVLSGNLDNKEMTPVLNSLTGSLTGQLLNTAVKAENSKLLSSLDRNVDFIDMSKLNLDNVKANLTFDDGKVNIKPIDLNYKDVGITVGGQHGFDQTMNYTVTFDVPAKYLGKEVNNLIASLNDTDASKITVPVNAVITGSFDNPKVSTDIKSSVTSLTQQLIQQQKDKLINQGKDKLKDKLNDILGGGKKEEENNNTDNNQSTDDKKEEKPEDKVKDAIKDLFGKKKKE
ncbi:hypothetical protein GCM10007424_22400 [Flavobacterium suaedae]|uniref:AsmA family protein n=1 Tax=Flavobacterium suaedae TaxID=1767027 RepID=A0ABQ1K280_9FLAO|nr:AsmA-like C-terminal region-containing protein [Flavobacterium suaedae]GGB81829.1 hypothetical protein GCM10007424_22400 [Flavobacterium suaedae]